MAVYVPGASAGSAGSQRYTGRWRVVSAGASPEGVQKPHFELQIAQSGETSYLPIGIGLTINGEAPQMTRLE